MLCCRHTRTRDLPKTPDVHQKCSKRAFDGQVRKWRRMLHDWDLPVNEENPDHVVVSPLERQGQTQGGKSGRVSEEVDKERLAKFPNLIANLTKRNRVKFSNSAAASPTTAPPELKTQKRWADMTDDDLVADMNADSGDGPAPLMMKWKDMVCNNLRREKETNEEGVILSYSDDEDDIPVLVSA